MSQHHEGWMPAVGAILKHLLLGHGMTMIGILGMLALGGIAVNTALTLITFANQ